MVSSLYPEFKGKNCSVVLLIPLSHWRFRKNLFVRMFEWVPAVWISFYSKSLLLLKMFPSSAI